MKDLTWIHFMRNSGKSLLERFNNSPAEVLASVSEDQIQTGAKNERLEVPKEFEVQHLISIF
jgi:hypothetical protein